MIGAIPFPWNNIYIDGFLIYNWYYNNNKKKECDTTKWFFFIGCEF